MTGQQPGPSAAEEITCDAVSRLYPGGNRPAVDQVSFRAAAGSVTVLLGPSGCGKTTLLKMINRLVEPSAGKIFVGGTEIHELPATLLRRRIGYVIQQVGLFPHMTIEQNIGVVPRLEGWAAAAIRERTAMLLEMVNLPVIYLKRYPRQLSGGEQQRVGLARALAADPGILLMDEPFGALDAITRRNLQDQLSQIQRQVAKTILFVTHDVDEAIRLGDQIAIMQAGRLVQIGTPMEILNQPASPFVAELVGSGNLLRRLSVMTAADLLARGSTSHHPANGSAGRESVRAGDDLRSVLSVMLQNGAEQIDVTDEAGQPVGSIHFSDLRAALNEVEAA